MIKNKEGFYEVVLFDANKTTIHGISYAEVKEKIKESVAEGKTFYSEFSQPTDVDSAGYVNLANVCARVKDFGFNDNESIVIGYLEPFGPLAKRFDALSNVDCQLGIRARVQINVDLTKTILDITAFDLILP